MGFFLVFFFFILSDGHPRHTWFGSDVWTECVCVCVCVRTHVSLYQERAVICKLLRDFNFPVACLESDEWRRKPLRLELSPPAPFGPPPSPIKRSCYMIRPLCK